MQPGTLLAGREVQVGLCPFAGPGVLVAIETGGSQPVLSREFDAVAHTHPSLLGGVDQEEPAERPPGLAAEARFRLLLENRHPFAGVHQFRRSDQSGQSGADDDNFCLLRHPVTPSSVVR